ncbi:MAG: hypothetical protein CMK59_03030 [Proteobacteria bacterium]|nr:hypothetical protein [Pseudomonadota bacterium]
MTKWVQTALLIFGVVHCAVLSWHFLPHCSDDGAIYARYIENFVLKGAIVWSSDLAVEGFSSPLWMLSLSLLQFCGVSFQLGSKFLGCLCGVFTLWLLFAGAQERFGRWWAIVALFGATTNMGFFYWMGSGLETSMVAFLWMWSFVFWGTKKGLLGLSLLGIARPEGFLVALVGLFLQPRSLRHWAVLVPCLLWTVFRLLYFGAIFPNTYYAKVDGDLVLRLTDGFGYVFPVLMTWCAGVLFFWNRSEERNSWLWVGIGVFAVFWGGGDWMWWGRMLVPFAPLCLFLLPRSWREVWVLVPVIYTCVQLSIPYKGVVAAYSGKRLPKIGFQEGTLFEQSNEQASFIRKMIAPGSLVAVNHAGFLPAALPEYEFLDMTGLNDPIIAKSTQGGLHQKYDIDYVLQRNPSAIVFHRRGGFNVNDPLKDANYWIGERELWNSNEFQQRYRLADVYWERRGSGGGIIYSFIAVQKSFMEERNFGL